MNISCIKRIFVIGAFLGPMVCGLGGFATRVGAQNAITPAVNRSDFVADSATQAAARWRTMN